MRNLTPPFLLQQVEEGASRGHFDAVVLFVDTSGFTPLTARLGEHGRDGAEVLSEILLAVFEPLVAAIYAHGGFIAGFAGDAFKAVFTGLTPESYLQALAAAEQIRGHMANHPTHLTRFGDFDFRVRISLADGQVTWAVWSAAREEMEQSHGYTFGGPALDLAIQGEDHAESGELVVTRAVFTALQAAHPAAISGVALLGAAENYIRIEQIARGLPAARSIPPDATDALAGASRFYPASLLITQSQGEFRPVYTVFINVQRLPAPGAADDFMPLFFQLLHQYGGYLCRIGRIGASDPGGTFLLFWGAPTSHENDLQRALGFLLALRTQVAIPLRAGITHAVVYAGFVGSALREEYTCHGSRVNQAARQMGVAQWGQLLLDADVAQRAQDEFKLALAGRFTLKGLAQEQLLFELQSQQTQAEPASFHVDFVGRGRELQALQDAVQPIFDGHFGGLTLVSGEAGIGKSRLVHEAINRLVQRDAQANLQVFQCQTDEILRESLNPFRYFLRRYFGQAAGAGDEINKASFRRKLDALLAVTTVDSLRHELERTHSFLGALVDLHWADSLYAQLEPQLRFENTLMALKTLLLAESLQRPVLLLLEDAHWLDEDSSTFLESLRRDVESYPLVVIATARLDEQRSESRFGREMVQQEIVLTALSADEVTNLAQEQLGGPIAPALLALLMERAEGNPFFAEQMLLYLAERTLLIHTQNEWQLADDAAVVSTLPDSVEAVLVARIDQLTQVVRQVVQTAAVLGREFDVLVLSQMLQQEAGIGERIRHAETAAIWSALSELRYLFKHALLRDAAYQMQLQAQRRQLHRLAAQSIETLYAANLAPLYGDLAHHFRYAGAVPQEAHYAAAAGHQAAGQFANRVALAYFTRALEITPAREIEARYDLLTAREGIYGRLGEREEQGQDIDALHALAAELSDATSVAKIWLRDCEFAEATGDYPRAQAAVDQAAALGENAEGIGAEIIVEATIQRGYVQILQGEHAAAQANLTRGYELAQERHLARQQVLSLQHLAQLHSRLGQYEEGKAAGLRALAGVGEIDEWAQMGFALNNIGICCLFLAEYDEAKLYFDQALQMKRTTGDRRGEGATLQNMGIVAYYEGALDVAMGYFEEALRVRRATGERASVGDMCSNLGVLYQTLGDYATALAYFTEAEQIHRDMGYQHGLAMALRNYSLLYYHLGDYDRAHSFVEEALEMARDLNILPDQASSLTNLGHILAAQGQPRAAEEAFVEAITLRRQSKQENLAIEAMTGLLNLAGVDAQQQAAWLDEVWRFLDAKGTDGMLEPYRIYYDCYRALAVRQDARAQPLLHRAYELIQAQAAKFSDENLRHSFLNNVAANRAIIAAHSPD